MILRGGGGGEEGEKRKGGRGEEGGGRGEKKKKEHISARTREYWPKPVRLRLAPSWLKLLNLTPSLRAL